MKTSVESNFAIFGPIFTNFSTKPENVESSRKLGMLYAILGSFGSFLNWEGPIFGPKSGQGKSLLCMRVAKALASLLIFA